MKAYCIKNPQGNLIPHYTCEYEAISKMRFINANIEFINWPNAESFGYKCVKIEIKEVEKELEQYNMKICEVDEKIKALKNKPKYIWEKCFCGYGTIVDQYSQIKPIGGNLAIHDGHKKVALYPEVAKSMLAMAQLSHIIVVANGDWMANFNNL